MRSYGTYQEAWEALNNRIKLEKENDLAWEAIKKRVRLETEKKKEKTQ